MPDEEAFEDLEAFYHAHVCLDEEKPAEAARWFQVSLNLDPNSKETAYMLLVAQRRAAFQSGKYEEYFRTSESLLELDGRTTQALLGMAPAWACLFASTGKEEYRQQALACLKEARTAGGADPNDWIIEGWVNKILEKRTVMSLLDFRYSVGKGEHRASQQSGRHRALDATVPERSLHLWIKVQLASGTRQAGLGYSWLTCCSEITWNTNSGIFLRETMLATSDRINP